MIIIFTYKNIFRAFYVSAYLNDFSKDNSSKILENIQKEDPRIKIINNNKNMGIIDEKPIIKKK